MEINKSLILSNPHITLEKIGYKLGYIEKNQVIDGLTILSNGFGKPRPNFSIAWGDNRQMLHIIKNDNHYLIAFGANRVVPNCVSIGKRENGIYYLIREFYDDNRANPSLERRHLFMLKYNQIISRHIRYDGQDFYNLSHISSKQEEYLNKIKESIQVFGEYLSILDSDSSVVEKQLRKF
jgi:hypothetical protein